MAGLEGTSFDQYHLMRIIGQGGMSEVYLAQDVHTGDQVAVKVVSGSNAVYLERFRREAETIDKLHHPHILPALDYGDQEPWHYLVMPFIASGTLRERLQHGPLTLTRASELLDQIADALQFAHDRGVIHRDIKPSNILMRDEHYIYLADFGLVKNLEGGEQLTQTGALLGTPEYMSPDLADGPATASSDVYALGVLLYQMVTGSVPFTGNTPIAVYWQHIRDIPTLPSLLNPELPPLIDAVLMKALAKDRTKRYQTVRELAETFRQAVYAPETVTQEEMAELIGAGQSASSVAEESTTTYTPSRRSTMPFSRRFGRRERSTNPQRSTLSKRPSSAQDTTMRAKRTPRLTASLPFLPLRRLRPINPTPPDAITPPPVIHAHTRSKRKERSQRLTRLGLMVITIGLLCFVILPMCYIYYIYNTQHTAVLAQATATAQAQMTQQAQATAIANSLLTAISSHPLINDTLDTNQNRDWTENSTNCSFVNSSYQVLANKNNILQACPLLVQQVGNGTVQVDVSLIDSGNAGLLLRANEEQYYDFEITNQGQFFFRRHDIGEGSTYVNLVPPKASSAILQGLQHNTLTAICQGNDFKLFINSAFVGEAHDSTYSTGSVSLVSGAQNSFTSGTTTFNNFKLFPPQ
jgi:serine/threonine protein kinase